MGVLCGGAVLFRVVTRRGRRQIWWICATVAPATSIPAGALLGNEHAVSAYLDTPNIAILLAGLCSVTGAGCAQIFWHAVRNAIPSQRAMLAHSGVAVVIGLSMIGLWLAAPIHDHPYASFRDIPISPEYVLYALLFQTYFAAVQLNAGLGAYQLLRHPPIHDPGLRDPGLRVALVLTIPAAGLTVVGQALYLLRLPVQVRDAFAGRDVLQTADLFTLAAMASYGVAGVTVILGPRLHAAVRARRLITALTPLWQRIRELYPVVALPAAQIAGRPALRAHRMLIEISDGLNLMNVPAEPHTEAMHAVAHELVHPHTGRRDGDNAASRVLPSPGSPREEEALFVAVAREFEEARVVPEPLKEAGVPPLAPP